MANNIPLITEIQLRFAAKRNIKGALGVYAVTYVGRTAKPSVAKATPHLPT